MSLSPLDLRAMTLAEMTQTIAAWNGANADGHQLSQVEEDDLLAVIEGYPTMPQETL